MAQPHENLLHHMPGFVLAVLLALFGAAALGSEQKVAVAVESSGEVFIVDASMDVGVSQEIAWDVMTDFNHMATILGNLTSSKVVSCDGNIWIIQQEGSAKFGLFTFPFKSRREVRLEPIKRILARNLSGTLKRMDDEATIVPMGHGVRIKYRVEIVVDSLLLQLFGLPFFRHGAEEQFLEMAQEMTRRHTHTESFEKQIARRDCPLEVSS